MAPRKVETFHHAFALQSQITDKATFKSAFKPPRIDRVANQNLQREPQPVNNLFYLLRNINGRFFERTSRDSRKANRFYKINVKISIENPAIKTLATDFRRKLGTTPEGAVARPFFEQTGLSPETSQVYQFSFNQFVAFKDFSEDTQQYMLLLITDKPVSRSQIPTYYLNNVVFVVVMEETECHIRVIKNGIFTKTLSFEAITVPYDLADFYTKIVIEATLNPNRIFETFSSRTMTISQESIDEKMSGDLASLCV
jgi:hypothetical protein